MESLQGCSDEVLARLFLQSEQSTEAFWLLLERLQPVLHAKVDAALRRTGGQIARDDLVQEAMMALLSAITAYKAERGASLRTFVAVCVSNRLQTALRKLKDAPVQEELIETVLPPGYESMDPQDLYAAMDDARRLQDVIQRQLTQLERNVLQAHMDGERYDAIAMRLGVTAKAVDNALQRARKKISQAIRS